MRLLDVQAAVELILQIPGTVRLAAPLGLGKPNVLLNALYEHFRANPSRRLEIYTALSLDPPTPKEFLAQRFYGPFLKRQLGPRYPRLAYREDQSLRRLPANISVHEFYFQAGQALGDARSQQDYISLNYTHVNPSLLDRGLNVIVQLVSPGPEGTVSLSSNPDLTLDLVKLARERNHPLLKIAVTHPGLPYLESDAIVTRDFFDAVLESEENHQELFALPRMPLNAASHSIGLHASRLVADGGTLQIGIGALSEALVYSLCLRQRQNALYRRALEIFRQPPRSLFHEESFTEGLYGLSEMVMDGFMHLREAGILHREVSGRYLEGAFFLGSKPFYAWLRGLTGKERAGLGMTSVSRVNDLYDPDESSLRRQRTKARFFNTCMQMSLLGGAISDTLDDGFVVSGVGGQYNFVAMSRELPDSLSVLLLKSTRQEKGRRRSNIVPEGGHQTIPRHLRDIVITEYGVADLRSKTDAECVAALIAVADAEFQEELVVAAQKAGKLPKDFTLPAEARQNTPAALAEKLRACRAESAALFPAYPFGNDFTAEEEILVRALGLLKKSGPLSLAGFWLKGISRGAQYRAELSRMGLEGGGLRGKLYAFLLRGALRSMDPRT